MFMTIYMTQSSRLIKCSLNTVKYLTMHLYLTWLWCGNTYNLYRLLNWLHELDSVLQEVLQPVDLVGLLLDPLSAFKEVVASFGLFAISFTFLASKHGWDKVHPLAVLVSIPILSITL